MNEKFYIVHGRTRPKNYLKSNHIIETFCSVSWDTVISGIKLPNFYVQLEHYLFWYYLKKINLGSLAICKVLESVNPLQFLLFAYELVDKRLKESLPLGQT